MTEQRMEAADIWCPFYHKDMGRSILCEGITDDCIIKLSFGKMQAKEQQMDLFCRSKNCEKCEIYRAVAERYEDE